MTTGYIWHELYGWSDTGSGGLFPADPGAGLQPISHHVAHPDTKRRIHELIVVSGLIDDLERLKPRHATEDDLLRVHTREHIDRIKYESALPKGGDAGDGTSPFGEGGYTIATLAAGGVIEMVEAVVTGTVDNGYALVHPCGHHARPRPVWGSACSTTVQWPLPTPGKYWASRRSRSWTGTYTTATARKPSSPKILPC